LIQRWHWPLKSTAKIVIRLLFIYRFDSYLEKYPLMTKPVCWIIPIRHCFLFDLDRQGKIIEIWLFITLLFIHGFDSFFNIITFIAKLKWFIQIWPWPLNVLDRQDQIWYLSYCFVLQDIRHFYEYSLIQYFSSDVYDFRNMKQSIGDTCGGSLCCIDLNY
jgi:hypothetical protein